MVYNDKNTHIKDLGYYPRSLYRPTQYDMEALIACALTQIDCILRVILNSITGFCTLLSRFLSLFIVLIVIIAIFLTVIITVVIVVLLLSSLLLVL